MTRLTKWVVGISAFCFLLAALPVGAAVLGGGSVSPSSASNTVSAALNTAPFQNRFTALASNVAPWRLGGFGDSLGDDVSVGWVDELGRGLGVNGGYLTVLTNSFNYPLTFTHSGDVTVTGVTTNWWADHFVMRDTADVTFGSQSRFVVANTFRVAMVHSTNGGTYKLQVSTNGGSFTDITATLDGLTAWPTGVVHSFATNLGDWKLKVVNVTGTNVVIGGGIWQSNRGGLSPAMLWRSGSTLSDVTAVHSNISVPVLASLGLTEVQWHAADTAADLAAALPTFCSLLARGASNAQVTFIGVNNITDQANGYTVGNAYVQEYVRALGHTYIDTERLGTTNDLVRRNWVTDAGCVHLNAQGVLYLQQLVWQDGGFDWSQNLLVGSSLAGRVPLKIFPALSQTSNLLEIVNSFGTTNLFYVTASGGVAIGERFAGGTHKLDVTGNVTMGTTNGSGALNFTRLNSGVSLAHQILFDAQNGNTASITYERDSGRFTLNAGVGIHMQIDADNNQTANYFSVGRDAANLTNATELFRVQENGMASVIAGGNSNKWAWVPGTLTNQTTVVASAGAAETNLQTYTLAANVMTNAQDSIKFRFAGNFAATANTKDLKVIFGSETILDTGAQIVNTGAWTIEGIITRTGNTSQTASAEFHGAGVTLFTTAAAVGLAQTNGIATVLKMTSTAAGDGDVTNRTMRVEYWPGI